MHAVYTEMETSYLESSQSEHRKATEGINECKGRCNCTKEVNSAYIMPLVEKHKAQEYTRC